MDGRDALLAVGHERRAAADRARLPGPHRWCPGLYGYVSACKWVVDIEATTFADRQAYWVQGGWAPQPPIRLAVAHRPAELVGARCRSARPVAVAGVAWDQHVGVAKVEVQVDDGPWQRGPAGRRARRPTPGGSGCWPWTPQQLGHLPDPGPRHRRQRPRAGRDSAATPFPSGATGLHTITRARRRLSDVRPTLDRVSSLATARPIARRAAARPHAAGAARSS